MNDYASYAERSTCRGCDLVAASIVTITIFAILVIF